MALTGVCCAIAAIALVSRVTGANGSAFAVRTLSYSLIAGGALGLQLVFLTLPGPTADLWPLVGARTCSIVLASLIMFRSRGRSTGPELRMPLIALIGLLDTAAFVFYLYATAHGLLSVVGPIVSLYPASTVALAMIIDRERVGALQSLGLGLAAASLVLTTL
jgi:drug/metabolite transporter (DMT)-like permease